MFITIAVHINGVCEIVPPFLEHPDHGSSTAQNPFSIKERLMEKAQYVLVLLGINHCLLSFDQYQFQYEWGGRTRRPCTTIIFESFVRPQLGVEELATTRNA
jgi:hypothetical protein